MRFLIFNTVVIAALILLFSGGADTLKQTFQGAPNQAAKTEEVVAKVEPAKAQKIVEIEPVNKFQDRLEAEVKARLEKAMKKLEEQKAASLDKANLIVERAAQKVQQAEEKASLAAEEASAAQAKMAALEAKLKALEEALAEADQHRQVAEALAPAVAPSPVQTTVEAQETAVPPLAEIEVAPHKTVAPKPVTAPAPRLEVQVAQAATAVAPPAAALEAPTTAPVVKADGQLMNADQRQRELNALVGNLEDLYARFTLR